MIVVDQHFLVPLNSTQILIKSFHFCIVNFDTVFDIAIDPQSVLINATLLL